VALFDAILQLLHGIRIIKIYQGERAEGERTMDGREYFDELIAMERVRAFARIVLESMAGLNVVVVIIIGGIPRYFRESSTGPNCLIFCSRCGAAQGPLNNINKAIWRFNAMGQRNAHRAAPGRKDRNQMCGWRSV